MSSQNPPKPSWWRKQAPNVAVIFLFWQIGCVLATGVLPLRNFFEPLNGFWVDGLRLANTWGMFSRPPRTADTLVEAVLADGRIVVLSSSYQFERSLLERIRNTRLRKIQAKLEEKADRDSFGVPYLDYYCRLALQDYPDVVRVRLRVDQPERLDDDNQVSQPHSEKVVLERRCPSPVAPPPAAVERAPAAEPNQ